MIYAGVVANYNTPVRIYNHSESEIQENSNCEPLATSGNHHRPTKSPRHNIRKNTISR